jgi:Flp pilus assembly protein protease CpaA
MCYAGIYDWKTRYVKPWTCIVNYILALTIAILKGATFKQIIISSIWLAAFFYIAALIFIKVTKNHDEGVGGGDILMAPAVTLFMFDKGLIPIFISSLLAWLDGLILGKKKSNYETPMITYFFIGCIAYLFL